MPSTSIKTSQIKDDAVTFDKVENATSENVLIGRGSGNGGGNYQPITVGSGLTMSGTTLSASGGGGASYPTQSAFKSTDQTTFTTSGTFSYDSALQISVTTTGWYSIEIYVVHNNVGGAYFGLSNTSGGYANASNSTNSGYDLSTGQTIGFSLSSGSIQFIKFSGVINLTAGNNLQLGYYRITSGGGNVTLYTGSCMQIYKVN